VSEFSGWADDLRVEVGGHGIVSHTGSVAVRALADRSGLTVYLPKIHPCWSEGVPTSEDDLGSRPDFDQVSRSLSGVGL
jgi:hypothetical protein